MSLEFSSQMTGIRGGAAPKTLSSSRESRRIPSPRLVQSAEKIAARRVELGLLTWKHFFSASFEYRKEK